MLDFDATPITAHSDKEDAAGHYKGGFGFNSLLVSCGREVLAAILRPGSAGANNAADHLDLRLIVRRERPHPGTQTPARDEEHPHRQTPPVPASCIGTAWAL
jgi:hypothetical protein